jgi:hypothetical protein
MNGFGAAVFENLEAGLTVVEVMKEFSVTREPPVHAAPADAYSV